MWLSLRRAWAWLTSTQPAPEPIMPDLPPAPPDVVPPRRLDPCERDCGRSGRVVWRIHRVELTLCVTCSSRHEYALIEQGWQTVYALEPA